MGSILNGIALHGPTRPYGGTFMVFSDYMRPAIRVAALSHIHVIYVFTHDSIGLGEDGPTHQPIEHVMSLRLIPNLDVYRPCDTIETALRTLCSVGTVVNSSTIHFRSSGNSSTHGSMSDSHTSAMSR